MLSRTRKGVKPQRSHCGPMVWSNGSKENTVMRRLVPWPLRTPDLHFAADEGEHVGFLAVLVHVCQAEGRGASELLASIQRVRLAGF